ncbi:MAG: hypothetical protein JW830_03955 [Bacteroidales bacterium]|nr:hypothetical protein [Bacteroidales bacterium]
MNSKEKQHKVILRLFQQAGMWLLLFPAIIAVIPGRLTGQPSPGFSSVAERIYVHLDKLVYIAGESLKYKVYMLNGVSPDSAPCSKIMYFSLTDVYNKVYASWRLNLALHSASGRYALPAELKAGTYILKAYTNQMRNEAADKVFSQNILVMSLSESNPDTIMVPRQPDNSGMPDPGARKNDPVLQLSISKRTYAVNEKIRLEISLDNRQMKDIDADLSISITAETPFKQLIMEADMAASLIKPVIPAKAVVPCRYPVENKVFILTGHIVHRDRNVSLANRKILLSVADSIAPRIRYTTTDSTGEFRFYLNRMFDNKELILRFGDPSGNTGYTLEIDPKVLTGGQRDLMPHPVSPDDITFLNTLKDLRIIEAIYTGKSEPRAQNNDFADASFFRPLDVMVNPGDYSDLVNFKEIADNIIPCVKFMNRNNAFFLQILNEKTGLWQESRFVMLNGVPFNDFNYIATLGTKDIKRIEVITRNYLLGDLLLPGLVSIYTHDCMIPENYLNSHTFRYINLVIPDDADIGNIPEKEADKRDPDFRTSLLWIPRLKISGKETRVIEIPASRLKGVFNIYIRGLTSDGSILNADTSFEVK